MGDRDSSNWSVLAKTDNGSTRFLGNETWQIQHSSYPAGQIDDYSIQLGNDYVQVIGLTPDNQAVLVIQDRVANGLSLEVIAGGIKTQQTPQEAAQEEFADESGWKARDLIYLGCHIPQTDRIVSRTYGNNGAKRCYMFLALGISITSQKLERTEKIEPIIVPWATALIAALSDKAIPPLTLPLEDTGSRLIILLADNYMREKGLLL